jgi:hypothetical protein
MRRTRDIVVEELTGPKSLLNDCLRFGQAVKWGAFLKHTIKVTHGDDCNSQGGISNRGAWNKVLAGYQGLPERDVIGR